jgi:hypothetical protein
MWNFLLAFCTIMLTVEAGIIAFRNLIGLGASGL